MGFVEDCWLIVRLGSSGVVQREAVLELVNRMTHAQSGDLGELGRLMDGWSDAGERLTEHVTHTQGAVSDAMGSWDGDAADGFREYMYSLIEVLEEHDEKTRDIKDKLDEVRDAIEKARNDIHDLADWTATALRDAGLAGGAGGAVGGAGAAVAAGPVGWTALLAAAIAAAAAIIAKAFEMLDEIENIRSEKVEATVRAMFKLSEMLKKGEVKELTGPPKPTIVTAPSFSSEDFRSDHQPPELDDTTIGTKPIAKGGFVGQAPR